VSSSTAKRPLHPALANAEALRELFPKSARERWEIAGSLRREEAWVGDADHVVIPAWGDRPSADLFGTPERVNLLWHHLDGLVAGGRVTKAVRPSGHLCWGASHRALVFDGVEHEIYLADADNWGAQLAIRTGPAELSQRLVNGLKRHARRNKDGYVWQCRTCECQYYSADGCGGRCQGTGLLTDYRIPVPDEGTYFRLAGLTYIHPRSRR
jgi:hypothetical protein